MGEDGKPQLQNRRQDRTIRRRADPDLFALWGCRGAARFQGRADQAVAL